MVPAVPGGQLQLPVPIRSFTLEVPVLQLMELQLIPDWPGKHGNIALFCRYTYKTYNRPATAHNTNNSKNPVPNAMFLSYHKIEKI